MIIFTNVPLASTITKGILAGKPIII